MKSKSTISLDEVLSGKVELPKGLIVNEVDGVTAVRLDGTVRMDKDIKVGINEFVSKVYGEIPDMKNLPKELKVGNYLVHDPEYPACLVIPGWIGDSIIRIADFRPLAYHVRGVGILEDHPCKLREAGWNLETLYNEIVFMKSWKVRDEEAMLKWVEEKKLKLVPDYDTVEPKIPLKTTYVKPKEE